ncbi:uncharacterized protein LOC131883794 [Tigriopus californicus]|uniref:uncharacterized protein LOC131883794 n=1 Tax=Tigriopus californicus TaxID=6832 RepID=UPI0027DAB43C|nr:uncharacterized protein LOC131883794 [Tigriopus californicus]
MLHRFESWHSTVRLLAWVLRFLNALGLEIPPYPMSYISKCITPDEYRLAECYWIRLAQRESFAEEITHIKQGLQPSNASGLRNAMPKFDKTLNLLVAQTRLNEELIILPRHHAVTEKIVLQFHNDHFHLDKTNLNALVRRRYWIQGSKREVQRIARLCLKPHCRKLVPLQEQMGTLPANLRVDEPSGFTNISVDLFGPLHPTDCDKAYGCIFTCLYSRAVHLELTPDLSAESFIEAFRRLIARRGQPKIVYSDNFKSFKAAEKELRHLYSYMDRPKISHAFPTIEWIYSIDRAPWTNGVTERLIRTVKTPLRVMLQRSALSFRQIETLLIEIEGIVNNRPLAVSEDRHQLHPITPAHLVIGRRMDLLPNDYAKIDERPTAQKWKHRTALLNQFWRRWSNDYLLELQPTRKWHHGQNLELKTNMVVMVRDKNLSRQDWKLGVIEDLHKNPQGLVHKATIRTVSHGKQRPSYITRHVRQLSILEALLAENK